MNQEFLSELAEKLDVTPNKLRVRYLKGDYVLIESPQNSAFVPIDFQAGVARKPVVIDGGLLHVRTAGDGKLSVFRKSRSGSYVLEIIDPGNNDGWIQVLETSDNNLAYNIQFGHAGSDVTSWDPDKRSLKTSSFHYGQQGTEVIDLRESSADCSSHLMN